LGLEKNVQTECAAVEFCIKTDYFGW